MSGIQTIQQMKGQELIAALTVYDASFARLLEKAGLDLLLVGDSLGMVIQGHPNTLPVQLDDMIYHTRAVRRGAANSFIITDLPFIQSLSIDHILPAAGKLIQSGADMVKLEGGDESVQYWIKTMTQRGIPVCAHLGLLPQSIKKIGAYRMQGRNEHSAKQLFEQARAVQKAGAQILILEYVPSSLAHRISQELSIPVIGIGAGPNCDGQILVLYDILAISPFQPSFSRNFIQDQNSIPSALKAYVNAVKSGHFPNDSETLK